MLKKILIGVMIVIVLFSSFAFYAYKKLEAQFESFIMAEVERQQAEVTKALEEKMEIAAKEAEAIAEAAAIKAEVERSKVIINDYFADNRNAHPNIRAFELEALTLDPSSNETDQASESNDLTTKNNDNVTSEVNTQVETTTSTQTEANTNSNVQTTESTQTETTQTESTVEEKEEVVEVYTKKDFDKDKKIAMELAMSRLTASQISRLIDISSGGFSPEEKQEAKEMFYSNFTAKEQNWILDIYTKYYYLVSEG